MNLNNTVKGKKNKITLTERGVQKYSFIIKKEKDIYSCLCLVPRYEKIAKTLENKYKFNSYEDWEKYVQDKYENYDKKYLMEFSRYLNQLLRGYKPIRSAYDVCVPILLTIVFQEFVKYFLLSVEVITSYRYLGLASIILDIVLLPFCLVFSIFGGKVLSPLWTNDLEENLIFDYKEIIDNMIDEKELIDNEK